MISSNENQDNINSNMISWGTSMVNNLVSGVTQTFGFGGESGDGGDKKPRELYFIAKSELFWDFLTNTSFPWL